MSNIYLNTEQQSIPPTDNQIECCHGHCVKKEIKLKKLISLKDFVLNYNPSKEQIFNYAKFLDNHLELGYFIVCDDDGNIFEEPKIEDYFDDGFNFEFNQKHFKDVVLEEYYNAKEKVLFENIPIAQAKWLVNTFSTIEHLSDITNTISPIYLTENAIKQIGL